MKIVIPKTASTPQHVQDAVLLQSQHCLQLERNPKGIFVLKCKQTNLSKLTRKSLTTIEVTIPSELYTILNGEPSKDKLSPSAPIEFQVTPDEPFRFTRKPAFFDTIPRNMFVFMDIVAPSNVGGQMLNVLKIAPLNMEAMEEGHYSTLHFQHLDWHELQVRRIREISCELRDQTGKLLQFDNEDTKEPVVLSLLFSAHNK